VTHDSWAHEETESHLSITGARLESELRPVGLVSVRILATRTLVVACWRCLVRVPAATLETFIQGGCCFETQLGHQLP
jgi:hypothetical protein